VNSPSLSAISVFPDNDTTSISVVPAPPIRGDTENQSEAPVTLQSEEREAGWEDDTPSPLSNIKDNWPDSEAGSSVSHEVSSVDNANAPISRNQKTKVFLISIKINLSDTKIYTQIPSYKRPDSIFC